MRFVFRLPATAFLILFFMFFVGCLELPQDRSVIQIRPAQVRFQQQARPPSNNQQTPTTTTTTRPPGSTTTTTQPTGGGAGPEEAFCPGGSNPDPNILFCSGFEKRNNCLTGRETQCWRDNHWSTQASGSWKILDDANSAVGSGSAQATPTVGGTGGGFIHENFPGGSIPAANMRFYIKFDYRSMSSPGKHGPALMGFGNNGCSFTVAFEPKQLNHHLYINNTCAPTPPVNNLNPNTSFKPPLESEKWYLIEMHVKSETSCTDITRWDGCNGEMIVWIDGQKSYDYTNINWGEGTKNPLWKSLYGVRDYHHARVQPFQYTQFYDNFVVSNGSYIGPAANENPRGQGDPTSPRGVYNGMEAFQGGHTAGDCTRGGNAYGVVFADAQPWNGNPGTRNLAMDHHLYQNTCAIDAQGYINGYLYEPSALQLDGSGGFWWARRKANLGASKFAPLEVIHGWIYLPSSNNYAGTEALSGVVEHGTKNEYLAMSVHNGQWAVLKKLRSSTASIALQSTTSVVMDQWQEFEFIVWMDGHISLMVDRQRIFDRAVVSLPDPSWSSQASPASLDLVLGTINAPGGFTIYYDDANIGTSSFWSCDGWNPNPALCPF